MDHDQLYELLWTLADKKIKASMVCSFDRHGKCMKARESPETMGGAFANCCGWHEKFYGKKCPGLTKDGCSIKSLECKFFLCDEAIEADKILRGYLKALSDVAVAADLDMDFFRDTRKGVK